MYYASHAPVPPYNEEGEWGARGLGACLDYNGDGVDDISMSSVDPLSPELDVLGVYYGSSSFGASGVVDLADSDVLIQLTPDATAGSESVYTNPEGAADWDGDGNIDLLVHRFASDYEDGAARMESELLLFRGGCGFYASGTVLTESDRYLSVSDPESGYLARDASISGDGNGDGFPELVLGRPASAGDDAGSLLVRSCPLAGGEYGIADFAEATYAGEDSAFGGVVSPPETSTETGARTSSWARGACGGPARGRGRGPCTWPVTDSGCTLCRAGGYGVAVIGAPVTLLSLLLACAAEPVESGATADIPVLTPPPAGEGFQVSMFGTAPPYTEVWLCSVYDLPTDEAAAVNSVEYLQNDGTHHVTLSTTYLSATPLPEGDHDCADLYADTNLMQDIVMMFGNQGEAEGTLTLPQGVAANLPAGIQLLQEIHYVNTTSEELAIYSYLNGWTIPQDDVVEGIWGGTVRDENIEIPPASEHTEWSRCVMNEDVEVQFLASHTHATATNFTIAPYDGVAPGDVFYSNDDWHDPKIQQFTSPLVVPAGEGFEFACTWSNPSEDTVNYGLLSTDEMCNMAIVFTPFSITAACDVVETSDGVLWEG